MVFCIFDAEAAAGSSSDAVIGVTITLSATTIILCVIMISVTIHLVHPHRKQRRHLIAFVPNQLIEMNNSVNTIPEPTQESGIVSSQVTTLNPILEAKGRHEIYALLVLLME